MSKDALELWADKLDNLIEYSKTSKVEERLQRNVSRRKGAKIEPDHDATVEDLSKENQSGGNDGDVISVQKSTSRQKENRKVQNMLQNQQLQVISWNPIDPHSLEKRKKGFNWNELHPDLQEYKKRKRRRDSKDMLLELSLETLSELYDV